MYPIVVDVVVLCCKRANDGWARWSLIDEKAGGFRKTVEVNRLIARECVK